MSEALEDGDGTWVDERWSPIVLTAMSGTEFKGREIPLAFQIEFEPAGDCFKAANARLEAAGIEPDGYGWGEFVLRSVRRKNQKLARRLHLSDCETDTCVIWVESDGDCKEILEMTWRLVFGK